MRALSGCNHCGHVERTKAGTPPPRDCPRCGFALRKVDLLTARMLTRERQRSERLREKVRAELFAGGGVARGRPQS